MFNIEQGEGIKIQLHNVAMYKCCHGVEYHDVISPFSRLYLITRGTGNITIGNEVIPLLGGYMYLIPSFTFCTYKFDPGMVQYYVHFSTSMNDGMNVYDFYSYHKMVKADTFDGFLLMKLLRLHPDISLPAQRPEEYQTKVWMNRKVVYKSVSSYLETKGIIEQLLAKFLYDDPNQKHEHFKLYYNIKPILQYIHQNLNQEIQVELLAKMACLSNDHFGRVFKSITGYPPMEYVIRKRIEKAQHLLLSSGLTQDEIIEKAGFRSLSYFSKMFRKYTGFSPGKYRKQSKQ